MIDAALQLAKRGCAVFPIVPRDKTPATVNGFKDATKDAAQIRRWWTSEPDYNIGIATGAASGFFVVDVDGLDAEANLRHLEEQFTPLPVTVECITGRGRHLYFKMPTCEVRCSASKIAPKIDVRGDGGYVVAPPSLHPSGRRYAWSVDTNNAFAHAPAWLLGRLGTAPRGMAAASEHWNDLVSNGVGEGARNDSIARLAGHLLRHWVDPYIAHGLLQSWNATHCKPPLSPKEVTATVNSICARELGRRRARG